MTDSTPSKNKGKRKRVVKDVDDSAADDQDSDVQLRERDTETSKANSQLDGAN